MARGRSYTVPLTPLIEYCDEWHRCDIADVWDGSIISSAVLRRDLVNLVTNINDTCHRDRQMTASILQEMIEGFFNRWYLFQRLASVLELAYHIVALRKG